MTDTACGLIWPSAPATRIWTGRPSVSVTVGLTVFLTPTCSAPVKALAAPRIIKPSPVSIIGSSSICTPAAFTVTSLSGSAHAGRSAVPAVMGSTLATPPSRRATMYCHGAIPTVAAAAGTATVCVPFWTRTLDALSADTLTECMTGGGG